MTTPTGPETDRRIADLEARGLLPKVPCVRCGNPATVAIRRDDGTDDGLVEHYCPPCRSQVMRHLAEVARAEQRQLDQYPEDAIPAGVVGNPSEPVQRRQQAHQTVNALIEQLRELPTVDLAELARQGVEAPELACDRLLYRGCLHSLAGPPEAGKSTLAYWWALAELDRGQAVVVVDVEAGPEQVTEKLLALGAKPDRLERLTYVYYPGARWDGQDLTGLRKLVERERAALVLFDSIGVALAQAGKDENHVSEVQPLYSALLELARDKQAAVVLLDHVTKDAKGGRYARGSGAKLQLVDVALMVDVVRPFDRQHSGQLRLTVSKDRRGYLGRHHDVKVEVDDGHLALTVATVDPAAPDPNADRLPPAAVKLLAALRGREEPQTVKELGDRMQRETGQALTWPTMRKMLNLLAELGFADGEGDPGKAKQWWALKTEDGGVPGVPTL